jgi:hypothetical protein
MNTRIRAFSEYGRINDPTPRARRAMSALIFVGECRSITAQRKGWTWADGRLAAKPLFAALAAMGVDPAAHEYANLWSDNASGTTYGNLGPGVRRSTIARIAARLAAGYVVVALGKRVSGELSRRGVDHVALVHPAARGKIRKRERYEAHVREALTPHLSSEDAMSYEIVRIARGRETVVESGPRTKLQARLRELRQSTQRGVSGRGGKKYAATYRLRRKTPASS